jgi:hypothetical protein
VETLTVTVAAKNLLASCVEVAVMVAVSAPVFGGVKTTPVPVATAVEALSVPPPDGLIVRFTVFVNAPVPLTVGVQVEVCVVVMVDGAHTSETPVMVGAPAVTVMFAKPEMLVNPAWVELALQVPVPAPEGVNTPEEVMVPPVAVQVTAEL